MLIGQASRAVSETEPEQRGGLVVSVHVNVGDFSLGDCQALSILRVAVPQTNVLSIRVVLFLAL